MINIRKAELKDIPRILELYEELTEKRNKAVPERVEKVFGEILNIPGQEFDCYKIQLLNNKRRQEAHQFYRSMGLEDSALGFRLYL